MVWTARPLRKSWRRFCPVALERYAHSDSWSNQPDCTRFRWHFGRRWRKCLQPVCASARCGAAMGATLKSRSRLHRCSRRVRVLWQTRHIRCRHQLCRRWRSRYSAANGGVDPGRHARLRQSCSPVREGTPFDTLPVPQQWCRLRIRLPTACHRPDPREFRHQPFAGAGLVRCGQVSCRVSTPGAG